MNPMLLKQSMLPNNMLGAIEPIDAGMLSGEQMSLPPVGDNYNQVRNMPTYGINPSAPPMVNGQVQEPMPQQPMTGMEKFQGVIDALRPISEMIDDENVRSVLPAEQYLKYKKEKEDQKQNRQNQLLDSMKLESDLKFRREQLDIQREENQIRREALLRGDSAPASIRQTDWYLNASEEERNVFDRVNKVGVEKVDIGSEIVLIDKTTGARVGSIPKDLAPADQPKTKEEQAAATERGKLNATLEDSLRKKTLDSNDAIGLLSKAEQLLPSATSGSAEGLVKSGAAVFGKSTEGSLADTQLNIISAKLVGAVPRFEGPQGVLDVELYKQAAGDLANTDKPSTDRMAALRLMKELAAKYATVPSANSGAPTTTTDTPKTRLKFNPASGDFE